MKHIGKARPKTATVLSYMGELYVALNPKQVWKVLIDQDTVTLKWRSLTMKTTLVKYKMFFKEIKEND